MVHEPYHKEIWYGERILGRAVGGGADEKVTGVVVLLQQYKNYFVTFCSGLVDCYSYQCGGARILNQATIGAGRGEDRMYVPVVLSASDQWLDPK